jgi:hypothetical protein
LAVSVMPDGPSPLYDMSSAILALSAAAVFTADASTTLRPSATGVVVVAFDPASLPQAARPKAAATMIATPE